MAKSSASRINRSLWLATLALSVCAGCSGGPKFYPVSGTVTLDGKPIAGAAVLFAPVGEGNPATGITDADGRYSLTTNNHAGAPAGQYRVAVSLQATGDWQGDATGTSGSPPPGTPMGEWIVPEAYASPDTSSLTAEVGGATKSFDFALAKSFKADH